MAGTRLTIGYEQVPTEGVGDEVLVFYEDGITETVARARVIVDSRLAAQVESGDIAIPLQKGLLREGDIAEIGEVIAGKAAGRSSPEQITFFKSVGVAVQDAMAARVAVANAKKMGLGTEVAW